MIYRFTAAVLTTAAMLATPALAVTEPEPPSCINDCEPEPKRGDNGWGNGADTTNAGSFKGGTASSKGSNGANRNDRNHPDALDKFEGR